MRSRCACFLSRDLSRGPAARMAATSPTSWWEDSLLCAAATCRNIVSSEGEKAGLSLYTFDPMAAFGGGTRLAEKTSSAGLSVWLEDDPVHVTASAYKDIL